MAYLEKKILVTIPVTEAHKTYLEERTALSSSIISIIKIVVCFPQK